MSFFKNCEILHMNVLFAYMYVCCVHAWCLQSYRESDPLEFWMDMNYHMDAEKQT